MKVKTTIQKILKSEGWYRRRFPTPHIRYWMWRLRSRRDGGWEDGYSTAKWWISLVPSSFHPNIGFLLSLFRNKDIKDPKIGCKNEESFKNTSVTTVPKWTSFRFAFRQRFCTFLTERGKHMRTDFLARLTNPETQHGVVLFDCEKTHGASKNKNERKKFQRVVEFYCYLSDYATHCWTRTTSCWQHD